MSSRWTGGFPPVCLLSLKGSLVSGTVDIHAHFLLALSLCRFEELVNFATYHRLRLHSGAVLAAYVGGWSQLAPSAIDAKISARLSPDGTLYPAGRGLGMRAQVCHSTVKHLPISHVHIFTVLVHTCHISMVVPTIVPILCRLCTDHVEALCFHSRRSPANEPA
jgi:hypothetical protein